MSSAKEKMEMVPHDNSDSGHPLAIGLLTGAAVGIGIGMVLAPRKGAELRDEIAARANNLASTASKGYHRASDTAGHYAHRGHDAYSACRSMVSRGAHETRRYVAEVTDAVTMKSRRNASDTGPVTASRTHATQPGSSREHVSPQHQAKNLTAV
jgi:gas vesicle protein